MKILAATLLSLASVGCGSLTSEDSNSSDTDRVRGGRSLNMSYQECISRFCLETGKYGDSYNSCESMCASRTASPYAQY